MLFWIIVIIFVVYYVSKKKQAAEGMQNRRADLYGDYGQGAYGANTATTQTVSSRDYSRPDEQRRTMTSADRARLEQYRAAKAAKTGSPIPVSPQQARERDILTRAKQNTKKYETDTTLKELEQEHNHTERVAETISKEALRQRAIQHPHDAAHVSEVIGEASASLMPAIEDLMIKGYDGKLPFERDFVGEGMDMISRFTVPDTISVHQE